MGKVVGFSGGGGGGGKFTGAMVPDSPRKPVAECSRGGNFGGKAGGDEAISVLTGSSPRLTSSMSDVTDILCAVRSGDFAGGAFSPFSST